MFSSRPVQLVMVDEKINGKVNFGTHGQMTVLINALKFPWNQSPQIPATGGEVPQS